MVLFCYFIFLLVFTSSLRSNQTAGFDLRSVVNSLLPESHLPDLLEHVPEFDSQFLYEGILVKDPTVFLQKVFEELATQLNGERNAIRHYVPIYNQIFLKSFLSTSHLPSSVLLLLSIDWKQIYKFFSEDLIPPHNAVQDFFSSYLTVQSFRSALLCQAVDFITDLDSLNFFLRLWEPQKAFSVEEDSLANIILSQVESLPFDDNVVSVKSLEQALLSNFPFKNHWEMKIVRDLLFPPKGILTSVLSKSFQTYKSKEPACFDSDQFNKIFLTELTQEIQNNSPLVLEIFKKHVECLKEQFFIECFKHRI